MEAGVPDKGGKAAMGADDPGGGGGSAGGGFPAGESGGSSFRRENPAIVTLFETRSSLRWAPSVKFEKGVSRGRPWWTIGLPFGDVDLGNRSASCVDAGEARPSDGRVNSVRNWTPSYPDPSTSAAVSSLPCTRITLPRMGRWIHIDSTGSPRAALTASP